MRATLFLAALQVTGCHGERDAATAATTPPPGISAPRSAPGEALGAASATAPGAAPAAAAAPTAALNAPAPPATPPPVATTALVQPSVELSKGQEALLTAWYGAVGPKKPDETFGELAVRAGLVQLDKPYYDAPPTDEPERLRINLDTFQCVSFVESSLSLARCIQAGTADTSCFVREVQAWRYRDGALGGFESRMHYFSEWLQDNTRRGRLGDITAQLGGTERHYDFFFMSTHASRYPAFSDPATLAAMKATEARLTQTPVVVIDREGVAKAERGLQTGDVIAITGKKAGVLVSHTGLILRTRDGVGHLLHASSHRGHVLLTTSGVASYVTRWPDRMGFLVYRPLPPESARPGLVAKP